MSLLAGAIVSISLALRARSHLNDWERLADGHRLSELIEIADEDLWPAQPTRVEAMDHWLSDARELRGRLGDHRAALEGFRRLALPWTAHERELDRASHQVSSRRNDIDQRIAFLREQHEKISGDITKLRDHATVIGEATPSSRTQRRLEANSDRILDLEQRRDEFTEETRTLEQELEQLEQRSATRLTWTFEDPRDQIRHDGLRDLVTGLEALAGEGAVVFPPTIAAVKARRKFAQSLRDGEQARRRAWTEAGQRVSANAAYDDLALSPVVGLIPIGPDPDSGLEEFAHLQSGAIPERDLAEGGLKITEDTGLVFVLLPGATVQMGAQSGDSSMEHFDAEALGNEGPVHKVTLDPFLISKFEVTQAQWRRFTGSNPSIYHPDYEPYPSYDVTWRHPVENVDWPTAVAVLRRMGLRLPTESQWEYACRATTATPWWTGRLRDTLRGAANLADQAAARAGARWAAIKDWPDLDDGFPLHAPVGSLRANGFGLHDVHGNVWEWCQDGYVWYAQHPARPRDGLRMGGPSRDRIARGAGFKNAAESSRSAGRLIGAETTKDEGMGVRPVHALHHH